MQTYRAYVTDENGRFQRVRPLPECTTDDEAMTAAEKFVDGSTIEVWERARRVCTIKLVHGKIVRDLA